MIASASSSLSCNLFLISRAAYYSISSVRPRSNPKRSGLVALLACRPLTEACCDEKPKSRRSSRSQQLCGTLDSILGRLVAAAFASRYLYSTSIQASIFETVPEYKHSKFPPFGPAYFWANPGVIHVGERIHVYSCDTSWCTFATIWMPLEPLPTTATRLPLSERSSGYPAECATTPRNVSRP